MKRKLLTALFASALLTTPALASNPDSLAAPQEPQTEETELQMPETMEELWAMYLDLMEKYTDLEAKYEELQIAYNELTGEKESETTKALPEAEYKAGAYKVGSTIPAGEYIIYPRSGGGLYYCVSSDANGDDIIFNEFTDGNGFATVYDGEYFTITSGYAVPYTGEEPIYNENNTFMAKVGDQIEAGEYLATAVDDYGYYAIYNDTRFDDIVNNDFFEGSSYIFVEDGQYLVISGCELTKQ